jgi:hypothetical protein
MVFAGPGQFGIAITSSCFTFVLVGQLHQRCTKEKRFRSKANEALLALCRGISAHFGANESRVNANTARWWPLSKRLSLPMAAQDKEEVFVPSGLVRQYVHSRLKVFVASIFSHMIHAVLFFWVMQGIKARYTSWFQASDLLFPVQIFIGSWMESNW